MVGRWLDRMFMGSKAGLMRVMSDAFVEGGEEAIQEGIQQLADNIIWNAAATESEWYRNTYDDVLEGALVGAGTGFMFSIMTAGLANAKAKATGGAFDSKAAAKVIAEVVHSSSVIEECCRIAEGFSVRARSALEPLPRNKAYDSLAELAGYVTERKS